MRTAKGIELLRDTSRLKKRIKLSKILGKITHRGDKAAHRSSPANHGETFHDPPLRRSVPAPARRGPSRPARNTLHPRPPPLKLRPAIREKVT
ncbi:hypothetical protein EVAR_42686_1 [Eumeta japonica]|uniref:Uncharacterized protein n=1 Tax=Eumeta variegata TaxID=151549 RepID=A0A4C1X2C7_EUMVA|nr:hypothetical protein EVAR_42686_1 [Eumeta japonica]